MENDSERDSDCDNDSDTVSEVWTFESSWDMT